MEDIQKRGEHRSCRPSPEFSWCQSKVSLEQAKGFTGLSLSP